MKKAIFLVLTLSMALLMFTNPSFAWQGRMAGMGNPYGLTADDSDFLIHPALITRGEGFDVYSHFTFMYTDINKWDIDIDFDNAAFSFDETFEASGDRFDYSALIGPVFPLGAGRMGIFFEYEGMDRDIDGDADYSFDFNDGSTSADFDLESDLDSFSLRLIYGLPIEFNCLNLGGEAKLSYIDEEQRNEWDNNSGWSFLNHPLASVQNSYTANTLYFQTPYDSDYWDAQFKASADGKICLDNINPIDITFTAGGGFIFAGDNEYDYEATFAGNKASVDADGDVDGYNLGAELWVRYLVDDDFSMPFMVRVSHSKKERDGDGTGKDPADIVGFDGYEIDYTHKEEVSEIKAGGGLDINLTKSSRVVAGLFYTHIHSTNDFDFSVESPGGFIGTYDDNTPDFWENRVSLEIGWEKALSDTTSLLFGFNTYWGFVNKEFTFSYSDNLGLGNYEEDEAELDGSHWGIMASVGSSIKMSGITLEPYINGGYRDLDLDGDFDIDSNLIALTSASGDMDEDRQEWFVGCGLSILFGN